MSNRAQPDAVEGPRTSAPFKPIDRSLLLALRAPVCCLLISSLLCGCASGLMSMPGAAMMASRFSKDDEKKKVT